MTRCKAIFMTKHNDLEGLVVEFEGMRPPDEYLISVPADVKLIKDDTPKHMTAKVRKFKLSSVFVNREPQNGWYEYYNDGKTCVKHPAFVFLEVEQ